MNRPPRRTEAKSSGFEYTRRTILKTGGVTGLASLIAGCGNDPGQSTNQTTQSPNPTTPTGSGTQQIESSDLVADGLEIISSQITKAEGLPGSDIAGPDLNTGQQSPYQYEQAHQRNYVQVLVKNTLDYPISAIRLFVETFDEQGRYLDVQSATISSLFPQEVFEGYVSYPLHNAAAYVIYADRSRRVDGGVTVGDVTLLDHCLDDEAVRGTVRNDGSSTVQRFRVAVRFYDSDGDAIGTGTDTVTQLSGGAQTKFEIDLDVTFDEDATSVTDYSITVGDYVGDVVAVR